jgi:hypothetical protein
MSKPNKRQAAILQLLATIESEGLHYGIVEHGVSSALKGIKDEELNDLVKSFCSITKLLESKLESLQKEVEPFLADDSDF